MVPDTPAGFWREAAGLRGKATPDVLRQVGPFALLSTLIWALDRFLDLSGRRDLDIGVAPYEVAGTALGLLLVLRTNAGYERWWEARKLWGGIVNQCRNLAVGALAYGPDDRRWRESLVRRTVVIAHVTRHSLRGERDMPEVATLLGDRDAARIASARHMPVAVVAEIAYLLRVARDHLGMDGSAFIQIDRERWMLLEHIGGCERILRTPLPSAYSVQIRRFIILFLVTLPFALLAKVTWMTPFVTVLVAYPILALDKIGNELQYPFAAGSLNHLPLDEFCRVIQDDLLALLEGASNSQEDLIASFRDGPRADAHVNRQAGRS